MNLESFCLRTSIALDILMKSSSCCMLSNASSDPSEPLSFDESSCCASVPAVFSGAIRFLFSSGSMKIKCAEFLARYLTKCAARLCGTVLYCELFQKSSEFRFE
jgi:hypothetical protein